MTARDFSYSPRKLLIRLAKAPILFLVIGGLIVLKDNGSRLFDYVIPLLGAGIAFAVAIVAQRAFRAHRSSAVRLRVDEDGITDVARGLSVPWENVESVTLDQAGFAGLEVSSLKIRVSDTEAYARTLSPLRRVGMGLLQDFHKCRLYLSLSDLDATPSEVLRAVKEWPHGDHASKRRRVEEVRALRR